MKTLAIQCGLCTLLVAVAGQAWGQATTPVVPVPPMPVTGGNPPVFVPPPPPGIGGPLVPVPVPPQLRNLPLQPDPVLRSSPSTNTVQPVFGGGGSFTDQVNRINEVVDRAIDLGSVFVNTQRIADSLEKGFPKILSLDTMSDQAKRKAADKGIRLAGNQDEPLPKPNPNPPLPPNPNPNPNQPADPNGPDNGFKQTIDEINKIFKSQAELIRSIDVGSVNRFRARGPGENGTVVLTGRTGFELSLLAPEVLDHFGVPRDQGLLVKAVYPKTPAADAGYLKGDILLEFDGKKVPSNFQDFLEKVMDKVKNNTPLSGLVLRNGERLAVAPMKVTDRRVIPALPNERLPDLTSIIQVVPGINSDQPNTNRVPEYRIIRNGLTTEIIPVYPNNTNNGNKK